MTGGPAAGAVGSGRADAGAVAFDVLDPAEFASLVPALAEVLADAVDSGSSVNFLAPFPVADAARWWEAQAAGVAAGDLRPVVARLDGEVVGLRLSRAVAEGQLAASRRDRARCSSTAARAIGASVPG